MRLLKIVLHQRQPLYRFDNITQIMLSETTDRILDSGYVPICEHDICERVHSQPSAGCSTQRCVHVVEGLNTQVQCNSGWKTYQPSGKCTSASMCEIPRPTCCGASISAYPSHCGTRWSLVVLLRTNGLPVTQTMTAPSYGSWLN